MAHTNKKRKSKLFGEIAVEKGLATQQQVNSALEVQKEHLETHKIHKEIGTILIENGVLTPEDVGYILNEQRSQFSFMAWIVELFNLSR